MAGPTAVITAVAGYVPDYVLTNKELETMVDTNDEWIRTRTGISERRILKEEGKATSDMGARALRELLDKRGMHPEDLELVICATVTPDMMFPDTANLICHKTGAKNAFGFDLSAACSGFLYALTTGAAFVRSGMYSKVAVVGADMMSSIVDYTDRSTCILFGDAAGAVLLEPTEEEGVGLVDSVLEADAVGADYLRQKAGGSLHPATHATVEAREHFIYQEGRAVFKYAVREMAGSVSKVLERNGIVKEELDWLVPHQANMRIIKSMADFLDMSIDRVMINIDRYGNTTAATIPLCLWEYESRLKKGDKLILTAFGGGFTWGACYLRWGYNN